MSDYSLELNEDQLQIQKWVHEFAENVVRPAGPEWDEREETPWPIIEEAAKNGLYSFDFIAQCFSDPTGLLMCLVNEEMSWGDAGIALAIFGSTLAVAGIFANGTPEQIGEWIPQCFGTADDVKLAAFGVSEPDAGSDVSSLKSRAVYDEAKDEWVLNGTKTWITNGGIANTHVLVLSVDPSLGSRGQASFVVPEGTPGISQGQKFKKMGIRASHTAEVVLEDCRVPGRCLLGGKEKLDERLARAKEGKKTSTQAAMATFEASRPIVGAQAVGIARAAYEYALDYAKERKQFGRAIIENQAIAFKLADMKMHTDAARLLVHRAANMASTGKKFENGEGSMSKLYAGENAVWVTEQAIQILGGYGYVREYPVEQWHRDSKIYTIFEGTSEIQRLVISRAISGNPHQLVPALPGARPELDRGPPILEGERRPGAEARQGDVVGDRRLVLAPDDLDDEGVAVGHRDAVEAGVNRPHHGVERGQVVTVEHGGPGTVGPGAGVALQPEAQPLVELDPAAHVVVGLQARVQRQQPCRPLQRRWEAERVSEPVRRDAGHAGELPPGELERRRRVGPLPHRSDEGQDQQVSLQAHLVDDPAQRRGGPVREAEVRHEGTPVVVPARIVRVDRRQLPGGRPGPGHRLGLGRDRQQGTVVVDRHRPVAGRRPVGRHPWGAMDGADPGLWVGGHRRGLERRILDVVAHGDDVVGAHGLDVHQRPAVVEPELSVVVIGDPVAEVHELRWRADVELHPLEDGLDRVTPEAQGALHAPRVDGTGSHPLGDGDVAHHVAPEGADEVRHPGPIDQVTGQQVLGDQEGQLVPAEAARSRAHRQHRARMRGIRSS